MGDVHSTCRASLLVALAGTGLLAACSRNLSLPPPPGPPGPGTIYGTVVYSVPGLATKQAASGATLQILGGGPSDTADSSGRFLIDGVTSSSGQLLIRFDATGAGRATHQLLIDLAEIGAGPGRQIGLGEVAVTQNAMLQGRARRADVPGSSGHVGTVVYVPQGPFTTYTADDGSYQLRDLPAGNLSIAFFRVGYQPVSIDGVVLSAGQDLTLTDQALQPTAAGTGAAPGSITGHVSFSPALPSAAGTSVVAVDGTGNSLTGSITAAGDFTVASVPPGIYQLTLAQSGYTPLLVANLLVAPGGNDVLPALVMSALPTGGGGSGSTCVAGTFCQPAANPCHTGAVTCGATPACVDTGSSAIDGTPCGPASFCQAGSCSLFCASGGGCVPANACHIGVVVCSSAGPVCGDTSASLPNGSACGPSMVCNAGSCVPCTGSSCGACSAACVPANPCHLGSQVCGSTSGCTDLGTPVADGIGCGSSQVCRGGTCVPCAAGVACQPANPCKTGVTSCSGGVSICAETGNVPDLTSCGAPSVCRAGTCVLPTATISALVRSAPTPVNPNAPSGVAVASNGDVYFSDSNDQEVKRISGGVVTVIAGTGACSFSGDSGPATSATLCNPRGLALDEANGLLYVADDGNARIRQIQLGGTRFINTFAGGSTTAPAPGYGDGGAATSALLATPTQLALALDTSVTPSVQYLYVADTGHGRIRRIDVASGIISAWLTPSGSCAQPAAFSACGVEPGCSMAFDGQGNAFVSGQFCGSDFNNNFVYGIARVSPSGAVTQISGYYLGGTAEGVNGRTAAWNYPPSLALDAAGNLFASDYGRNLVRRIDGASGRIVTVVGTGAASSTGDGGSATAATIYGPYAIAFNPASRLDLVLTEALGNAVRLVQNLGTIAPPVATLSYSSGNVPAPGIVIDQPAPGPLVAKLTDAGSAPLPGYLVSFAGLTSGGSLSAPAVATDAAGAASVSARVGQAPGTYSFQATFRDIHGNHVAGSPVTFSIVASAPAPGTIYTAVNGAHLAGNAGAGGPGTLALINAPAGVAVASNGDVYFTDSNNHQVKKLSGGIVTLVAGTGACSFSGDNGPATSATLCGPRGLALDEANGLLYVADDSNARIRQIQLGASTISTFAGGGNPATVLGPGYGDGGAATAAVLASPTQLALAFDQSTPPVRYLYIADTGHNRIRRVDANYGAVPPDAALGTISAWLTPSGSCTQPANFSACGAEPACSMAFDAQGNTFVSGQFCGSDFNNNFVYGIARVSPAGALAQISGYYLGSTAEGVNGRTAAWSSPPNLALDAAGNLYATDYTRNVIRRIESASGRIATVAGTGAASDAGDLGPAAAASLNGPWAIAFAPPGDVDLVVTEYLGNSLRIAPGFGTATPSKATLALSSGNLQTILPDQPELVQAAAPPAPLSVSLVDGAGAPLSGYFVPFTSLTAGASLSSPVATTSASGIASASPRAGLAPQAYQFQAAFSDIHGSAVAGSPVAFSLTAAAPAAGTIFDVVNDGRVAGNSGAGGPGALALVNQPYGIQVSSGGTIYFSDGANHQVKALAPSGILTVVAGTGACGSAGDTGPATQATLCNPRGLALDETPPGKLYIADLSNNRIRVVNLTTGRIDLVAGTGTATAAPWGDGNAATSATLSSPTHVRVRGTSLYIADSGHAAIRVVDLSLATPTISTWISNYSGTNSCTPAATFWGCAVDSGCDVAWDATGKAFISGQFCGTSFGGSFAYGVATWDGVNLTQVAGKFGGGYGDNLAATGAAFLSPPSLAFDPSGRLFLAVPGSANSIRTIDATGFISTWAGAYSTANGTGTPGWSGNYVPVSPVNVTLDYPWEIAFGAGHAAISDTSNAVVRLVW